MDEIQQEFEELLKGGETAPAEEAAKADEIAYYLGDKQNKLPVNAELEFVEGGKPIRQSLSTILNHYRQRSELDKRYGEFKKERESWDSEVGDRETYIQQKEKFGALQDWSEKNPEEFQTIWDMYQNRDKHLLASKVQAETGAQVPQAVLNEISSLKAELSGLKEFKSQFDKQQEEIKDQKAYEAVSSEMESFKKDFPEFNLEEAQEDGLPLFKHILIHGVRRGIDDFRLAAQDYLGPKLHEALIARGRNEAVKSVRQDKQQGIVSRSSKPGTGQSDLDTSKMSWADLNKLAKGELEGVLGNT